MLAVVFDRILENLPRDNAPSSATARPMA